MRAGEMPGTAGGIRRAAVRLGLSPREARGIVLWTDGQPRDETALAAGLSAILVERSLEHGWPATLVRLLVAEAAEAIGADLDSFREHVHARSTTNPSLLALSPPLALEIQLRMLRALAANVDVS